MTYFDTKNNAMKRNKRTSFISIGVVTIAFTIASLFSCSVEPPLHLYDGIDIEWPELPMVDLDIEVIWEYEWEIDWKLEWEYGWDIKDSAIFGPIGYTEPKSFELRRYYNLADSVAPHYIVTSHHVDGKNFKASYNFGWYDLLLWNTIQTKDGVQSIIIDESDLDNTIARTNKTMYSVRTGAESAVTNQTYYQPEDLFADYITKVHITTNVDDYDYYDPVKRIYYKKLKGELQPLVYIYLPQLIIHNNRGRLSAVDGNAVLTGMAYKTNMNTGMTGNQDINVYFNDRMKNNITIKNGKNKGEVVDIVGGRLTSFGICNTNPYEIKTRATVNDSIPHYIGMTVQFNNGMDSTMVFDVTETLRRHYRGGVLTMEIDMDTVPIPQRSGGSGFDAVVKDFEEETYEFDM